MGLDTKSASSIVMAALNNICRLTIIENIQKSSMCVYIVGTSYLLVPSEGGISDSHPFLRLPLPHLSLHIPNPVTAR